MTYKILKSILEGDGILKRIGWKLFQKLLIGASTQNNDVNMSIIKLSNKNMIESGTREFAERSCKR